MLRTIKEHFSHEVLVLSMLRETYEDILALIKHVNLQTNEGQIHILYEVERKKKLVLVLSLLFWVAPAIHIIPC